MKTFKEIMEKITDDSQFDSSLKITGKDLVFPIFYSEDNNGNINFDTESMKQEFEYFLEALENYNDENDFNWDDLDINFNVDTQKFELK